MLRKTLAKGVVILLCAVGTCWPACCAKDSGPQCRKEVKADPVEKVLEELRQRTEQLESYQSQIEHSVKQPLAPDIESTTLRKGVFYYQKVGAQSRLRINFETLRQDDEKERKYAEQFIFDGVWLTKIDYQIKQVTRKQLAEPNEPVDALELARRNFPIVGFTKVEELKKDFETTLVEQEEPGKDTLVQLHLKVKPDSVYKDDYTTIDFWVDKASGLPARIVAVTTADDIYEIRLLKPQVNKKIDGKVFDFKVPKDFTVDQTPLEIRKGRAGTEPPAK
ncbi:MAG TPA: hypothetical protein VMW16_16790 [Sedimentisphaerales bacterium]|nr:hypothetical protein [Sedimentisphaerales bacterium]